MSLLQTFVGYYVMLTLLDAIYGKGIPFKREKLAKLVIWVLVAGIVAFLVYSQEQDYTLSVPVITVAVWYALSYYAVQDELINNLSTAWAYTIIIYSFTFTVITAMEGFFGFSELTYNVISKAGPARTVYIVGVVLSVILVYIAAVNNRFALKPDKTTGIILIAFCGFSLFCMHFLVKEGQKGSIPAHRDIFLIAWLFIFLFTLSLIFVILSYGKVMEEKTANSVISTRIGSLQDKVQQLDSSYERIAKLSHDHKNHIGAIKLLAANKQYDQLSAYLDEISEYSAASKQAFYTGMTVADAMIEEKRLLAKSKDVAMEVDAVPVGLSKIKAMDVCAILSNLLDNAIEASGSIPAEERSIKLKIHSVNSMVIFKVENNFNSQKCIRKDGSYLSTKESDLPHGYGLKIVSSVAEAYNGSFSVSDKNGVFTAIVMLSVA